MKKEWLIELRKRKGFSQSQLAREIGMSQQLVSKVENGECPSVSTAKRIAKFLEFEWTLLFEE